MWNQVKTIAMLGVLTTFAVGTASWLAPGWTYAFVVMALISNLGAYFFSDRIVLRMHGARAIEAPDYPALRQMNEDLAREAGIAAPKLYLIEADYANAFATGRGPGNAAIAVTAGLLARLTPRELKGVMAHEMAHVVNRDILIATVAAMLAAVISGVANALQFSALFGGSASRDEDGESASPLGMLAFAFAAPLAASLVQLAISRAREFVADETAARLTRDPEALASALARLHSLTLSGFAGDVPAPATASLFIVAPFAGVTGRLTSLFSTHPPVEARIERLRALMVRMGRAA